MLKNSIVTCLPYYRRSRIMLRVENSDFFRPKAKKIMNAFLQEKIPGLFRNFRWELSELSYSEKMNNEAMHNSLCFLKNTLRFFLNFSRFLDVYEVFLQEFEIETNFVIKSKATTFILFSSSSWCSSEMLNFISPRNLACLLFVEWQTT